MRSAAGCRADTAPDAPRTAGTARNRGAPHKRESRRRIRVARSYVGKQSATREHAEPERERSCGVQTRKRRHADIAIPDYERPPRSGVEESRVQERRQNQCKLDLKGRIRQ